MGYDNLLAAAVAGELDALLAGRKLTLLSATPGVGVVLCFGPRRDPAYVVLAAEPLPAVYGGAGQPPEALYLHHASSTPPPSGLEPFIRLVEVRLIGRVLARVGHQPWERVIELAFGPRDGLRGDRDPAFLIHEAAPKPARLVLLGPDRAVAGVWPAPDGGRSDERLERGRAYRPPTPPWSATPDQVAGDLELLTQRWNEAVAHTRTTSATAGGWEDGGRERPVLLSDLIRRAVPALGPAAAAAVAGRLAQRGVLARDLEPRDPRLDAPAVVAAVQSALIEVISCYPHGPFRPSLITDDHQPPSIIDVAAVDIEPRPGRLVVPAASASQAVAAWHLGRRTRDLVEGAAARTTRKVHTALERARRKTERRAKDRARAGDAARHQRFGELLLANLHRLSAGDRAAEVTDYDGSAVTIPLDPRLGPSSNAQRYFDLYRKARRAEAQAGRYDRARSEELWLEALAYDLERAIGAASDRGAQATLDELEAIALEVDRIAGTPPGRPTRAGAPEPAPGAQPARYLTADGRVVLAGRSARENEVVSLRLADPDDLWFHARNCPGSHVVLRRSPGGGPPSEAALLQAAALAAHLSAARNAGKVEVDYTPARNLRRPKGAPRGLVLYDPHQTILVDTARIPLPRQLASGEMPEETVE